MSTFHGVRSANALQQESNRRITMVKQPNMWISTAMDEFRDGFPSDGLSTMRNQWWGSKDDCKADEEDKVGKEEDVKKNGDESIDEGNEKKVGLKGSEALVVIRKSIAKEGREMLKHGRLKGNGLKKMVRRDRALLVRVFNSSLPKEWMSDRVSNSLSNVYAEP